MMRQQNMSFAERPMLEFSKQGGLMTLMNTIFPKKEPLRINVRNVEGEESKIAQNGPMNKTKKQNS